MLILALAHAIRDIPNGWATLGAAVVDVTGPVCFGIVAALMGWVLRRLKKVQGHAAAAEAGVTNSHEKNLRDDLDGKQDETRSLLTAALDKLSQIQRIQVDQGRDIGGIRQELRTLHANDELHNREQGRLREHIDEIERTIPKTHPG